MDASAEYIWTPPEFGLPHPPRCVASLRLDSDTSGPGNFARSAKWCPDGSVSLVQLEHREFRMLVPPGAQNDTSGKVSVDLQHHTHFTNPAPILDYAWYPSATLANPASYCFVTSVRETPVKLLDASDGRLRASYRIVDHRERQIAPHSLAFNLPATRLYCGFEDAIEVFDVGRPGEGTRLLTTPSKKSKDGLKGIISALAFSPSYETDFYAAGSLTPTPGNIVMFSEADGAAPVLFVGGGPAAGVTQLRFNPMQPHIMYAAFRRRRAVYSWDLRADGGAPLKIFSTSPHVNEPPVSDTNQKRQFDIDVAGRFLSVGDQEGRISVFDLTTEDRVVEDQDGVPVAAPCLTYSGHKDAIGAVAFHPSRPQLLTVSGSRHFHSSPPEESGSSEDEFDEGRDQCDGTFQAGVRRAAVRPAPVPLDASVTLWDFQSRSI
ncbi:WD40-repeat-containing domain protein [Mycena belliarum]|uniref:WD40-repeat-containing domain protein n=1 Tax=Mycena belliarum TaxID=1033014 RepID=A0AAD6U5L8_9AGAR|nr:WD40-repeat-containing domain protein [Mycena belliae]